ncbi:unnamed protein product [Prorocentrum cordatum]|uniref:Uncharacterized protein n=1 Tax=Prorocentrum cordatum TaxID=2364126 RepID=A0ABN9X4K9_9DINO|nr:unnamed protein product [Polarella glacialis]
MLAGDLARAERSHDKTSSPAPCVSILCWRVTAVMLAGGTQRDQDEEEEEEEGWGGDSARTSEFDGRGEVPPGGGPSRRWSCIYSRPGAPASRQSRRRPL